MLSFSLCVRSTVSGSLPQRHSQGNETNVRMTDSETVLTDIVLFCIY